MINNNIFPQLQSGYCSHHSTETALLKVKNNLLMNMEESRVSLLLLLDLSAAIDTVDHGIFLQSLQKKIGVCGTARSRFKSFLERRYQRICIKETLSQPLDLKCGVPQVLVSDRFCLLITHKTCSLFWGLVSHLHMHMRTTLNCVCHLVLMLAPERQMTLQPLKTVFKTPARWCARRNYYSMMTRLSSCLLGRTIR